MTSATFIKMRVDSAEQFKESVSEPTPNTKLYITYGRTTPWTDDNTPPAANTSVATEYEVWQHMIGGKKLLGYDMCHVIPRFDWANNTTYVAYDNLNPNLHDGQTQFYIMTSDYNVYKCIANNNGSASTVEPKAINPGSITATSDGYIWKYMYSISDSDQLRFMTDQYIPIRTLSIDDGSLQWKVQDNTTEGAIYSIVVENGGSNYSNSSNLVINVSGDGASATATGNINVSTNTISSITMTDYGIGYTYASVSISGGGGSNATGRAIISPPKGHGINALYELGGAYLMINLQLKGIEEGYLKATNDFRQIAILKDPLDRAGNVMSNLRFSQSYTFNLDGTGNYVEDEIVYQGPTLGTAFFRGTILSWDAANSKAVVINTSGTPAAQSLTGASSSTVRYLSLPIVEKELSPYSGQLLYVDNIRPITRATDQTEDFKIVLKF